jgi:hypothetical protein
MDWEALLDEFRALGGTAENVRVAEGRYGRGLFVVDPALPAKIHACERLLVPIDALELRDGRLAVKAGAGVGERERAFFEAYQQHLGWGNGGREAAWRSHEAWNRLPSAVVEYVKHMGALEDPQRRFEVPSMEACARRYVNERDFFYGGGLYMAPFVDLTNHRGTAAPFVLEGGLGVAGTFDDEMLVRYNARDPWENALTYGFSDLAVFAYSLAIDVDVRGRRFSIGRKFADGEVREGIRWPLVETAGDAVRLGHVVLGNPAAPDLPRAVFRRIVAPYLTATEADDAFDGIQHFNRTKFLDVLRLLKTNDGPLVRMLEDAAIHQLQTLSHSIGARPL